MDRRGFLKRALAGAAALVSLPATRVPGLPGGLLAPAFGATTIRPLWPDPDDLPAMDWSVYGQPTPLAEIWAGEGTSPLATIAAQEAKVRDKEPTINQQNIYQWNITSHDRNYHEALENLALVLHESGREAVMQGATLVKSGDLGFKQPTFVEWHELPEHAKEGRRIQARYILARYNISPRF